jgi:AbrB family looped-hinge helix DNA binding protein
MEAEVRDKGRITIPRKIRKALGIKEGDRVIVEVKGNNIVIKPKDAITVSQTFGIVRSKKRIRLEDIEEAAGRDALS